MEYNYKKFFEQSPDIHCILGVDGYFKTLNKAFLEAVGYTRGELITLPLREIIHAEDREAVKTQLESLKESEPGAQFRCRVMGKDRKSIWWSCSCSLETESRHIYMAARDVTTQVSCEAECHKQKSVLRAIHEIANIGSWEWDAQSDMLTFSEHMYRILGIEPTQQENSFELFSEFIHPEDEHLIMKALDRSSHLYRQMPFEYRILRPDGSVRHVWSDIEFFVDDHGELLSILGAVQDVTERKVLESQLVQSQRLESIGQLATGIAHEINTPIQYVGDNTRFIQDSFIELEKLLEAYQEFLNNAKEKSISMNEIAAVEDTLEVIDFEYLSEEIPTAIEQSLEGIDRVAKIVKAMKEFSHPGNEEMQPADLNHAIESAVTIACSEWKFVADVEMNLDPELPDILCLASELNQVFLNIIVNASHAIASKLGDTPSQKGLITISSSDEEEWLEIRIKDNGGGIPEDVQDRIFEPFFTTKDIGKGTGQGLAIAHSVVVDQHEGELFFEAEKGVGTTFVIRIPKIVETELGAVK